MKRLIGLEQCVTLFVAVYIIIQYTCTVRLCEWDHHHYWIDYTYHVTVQGLWGSLRLILVLFGMAVALTAQKSRLSQRSRRSLAKVRPVEKTWIEGCGELFKLDDPEQWQPPDGATVVPPPHIEKTIRRKKHRPSAGKRGVSLRQYRARSKCDRTFTSCWTRRTSPMSATRTLVTIFGMKILSRRRVVLRAFWENERRDGLSWNDCTILMSLNAWRNTLCLLRTSNFILLSKFCCPIFIIHSWWFGWRRKVKGNTLV